ncbi:late competence protein ComER [Texcoconibacillus texcoconensis]|uniref:Competence protein ComER n=1 Tax=Texcoconibacillus texcoconensis TaxID=1095777 RepID=A0A840QR77_9BACI|nr:late competence protein ComER [Texcoconibacillus texcoconensis]MBB5173966.1 competence protein ComER [Texcoconibacillus texcoconensis]
MHTIGFIGTGSMGRILIEAYANAEGTNQSHIVIHNRTREKAEDIKRDYPDIKVADSAEDVAKQADFIFICAKPLQIIPLLQSINTSLHKDKMIISITSPITVDELEEVVSCKAARFIPSITNRALAGSSLITYGSRLGKKDQENLWSLAEKISQPIVIDDSITRVSSDIVSCGPAFFSFLLEDFIQAATQQTNISEYEARKLTSDMMIGFATLLSDEHFTLSSLQERVSVPGGVTGKGLDVLRGQVGSMFHDLFIATHEKYAHDRAQIQEQVNALNKS